MDRRIYEYPDGASPGRTARADPALLQRGLLRAARATGQGWYALYQGWADANHALARARDVEEDAARMRAAGLLPGDAAAPTAWTEEDSERFEDLTERVAGVVREAFGIRPFDGATGAGLLQSEVLDILYDFIGWQKKSGTSTSPTPTTSGPSGGDRPDTSSPSSAGPSTTTSPTA